MALNRYIYILDAAKQEENNNLYMKILNKFEFEGAAKFSLFEDKDLISLMHD